MEDDFVFTETAPEEKTIATPKDNTGVIMRVLHTRTEIKIYPGGNVFQKSSSWFENTTYNVTRKEKPKAKELQKVSLKSKEEY